MKELQKFIILALVLFAAILTLSSASAEPSEYYVQQDTYIPHEKPYDYSFYSKPSSYTSYIKPSYPIYTRPIFSTSYSSSASYRESPGQIQFPKESFAQNINAKSSNSNFDSSSLNYDYRGPMYERQSTYIDDFSHRISDKSGFFTSRNRYNLRHTITSTLTEKYIGATESLFADSQNRRLSSSETNQNTNYNYDGGFSFGKQRTFDSSEYAKDSYTEPYYYRPSYDSNQGYYNWRY